MNAVSSHRPHARSAEFARNQALAKRTWEPVFKQIVYVGPQEPELDSEKTTFIYSEDFPSIQTLAKVAANLRGITALLNADISLGPRIRNVEYRMLSGGLKCASSRRYHFDPHNPQWEMAALDEKDRGRDIFMAKQQVWQKVADTIPPHFRIGHQQWDAWMSDFFRDKVVPIGREYDPSKDFTKERCVFHPHHGDRQMPHAQEIIQGQAA